MKVLFWQSSLKLKNKLIYLNSKILIMFIWIDMKKPTLLMERFPYRYVQVGTLEINGKPDCRIQKVDSYTGRYRDMYLCDNEMQLLTAMEDHDYTCWLDPDNVPAYVHAD